MNEVPAVQIDPAVLQGAGTHLAGHAEKMAELVKTVDKLHSELGELWTGPASTVAAEHWTETGPVLTAHATALHNQGQSLGIAVENYDGADTEGEGGLRNV